MRGLNRHAIPGLLSLWLLVGAGCARDVIPNTDVENTSENREVLRFVERYRQAVEQRNVGAMLTLVSPHYFDDFGTPSTDDDLDLLGLREQLAGWQTRVLDVRYEIRYRRVTRVMDKVFVDYTYTASFRVSSDVGARWARRLADNRLVLTLDGDDFRILSGM